MTEITELKVVWFNNRWDMFIHGHTGLKNYTKVFAESLGEIVLEPKLIISTGRFSSFG